MATTTTPESRGRIAYVAFTRAMDGVVAAAIRPSFDQLTPDERAAWVKAAGALWELATTGRTTI